MRGRLRVVIATTDGPSAVRRITAEDPDLRSVVCLAGTATALPISADYDAFVRRPTGVVERDNGHRVYRVDVDRPIDDGRSWQLGLYLAHRLKAVGRLAEDDDPADGVLWATGTVDSDLDIGPVERVADKARRSQALVDAGLPVLAVSAPANGGSLPVGAEHLAVSRVDEILVHLGLSEEPARTGTGVRRGVAAACFVILLLAVAAWTVWNGGPTKEAVRALIVAEAPPARSQESGAPQPSDAAAFDPVDVLFEVIEGRPNGGQCDAGTAVDPSVDSAPGVCAVAFRATNSGARPARIWLYAVVQGTFREYASRKRLTELADGTLAPGESGEVRVQPPDWVRRPVIVRGLLILADADRTQVDHALVSIDLMSSDALDTMVAGLRGLDVEVREIFHRVTPAR